MTELKNGSVASPENVPIQILGYPIFVSDLSYYSLYKHIYILLGMLLVKEHSASSAGLLRLL